MENVYIYSSKYLGHLSRTIFQRCLPGTLMSSASNANPCILYIFDCVLKLIAVEGAFQNRKSGLFILVERSLGTNVFMIIEMLNVHTGFKIYYTGIIAFVMKFVISDTRNCELLLTSEF